MHFCSFSAYYAYLVAACALYIFYRFFTLAVRVLLFNVSEGRYFMLSAIEVAQRYQELTRFVTALSPYHAMIANDLIVVDVVLLKEHYTILNLLIPIIVGLTHNLLYFPFCLGSVLSIEQLSFQTKQH